MPKQRVFFAGCFIHSFPQNFEALPLIKTNRPHVLLVHIQAQFRLFRLYKVQQALPYAPRLHFTGNKNAFDIFPVQPYKAPYFPVIFVNIDFCPGQHFFYRGKVAFPILWGNKAVRPQIGVQPYVGDPVYVCVLQFPYHHSFSRFSVQYSIPEKPGKSILHPKRHGFLKRFPKISFSHASLFRKNGL